MSSWILTQVRKAKLKRIAQAEHEAETGFVYVSLFLFVPVVASVAMSVVVYSSLCLLVSL